MSTATAPAIDVRSVLHMSRISQRSPSAIQKALDKFGFAPAANINGVAHYSADAEDAVFNYFVEEDRRKATGGRN